jgi:hypothetical protein
MTRENLAKKLHMAALQLSPGAPDVYLTNQSIRHLVAQYPTGFELKDLNRPILALLCAYMAESIWGPSFMLRHRLERLRRNLREEDVLIAQMLLNELDMKELQFILERRGIRAKGLHRTVMERSLKEWLDLQLQTPPIPTALLIGSRPFQFLK